MLFHVYANNGTNRVLNTVLCKSNESEIRRTTLLFNGIQRIFEQSDMCTKYSRNIVASVVLTQGEFSGCASKSRSACSELFQRSFNEHNELSF